MGSDTNLKNRDEMDLTFRWNIEAMYPEETQWDRDVKRAEAMAEAFSSFSGRLSEGPQVLLEAFRAKDALWQVVEKVFVYARMKKDEDTRVAKYQAMSDKAQTLIAKVGAKGSFFTPELLALSEDILLGYLDSSDELVLYRHVIQQILREKAHVLSHTEEKLLAQVSELTSATNDIFSMINNADIKFGTIDDEDGNPVEVTHGRYVRFMESSNRRVRKDAFESMYKAYEAQKNTLATTYQYNTKTDVVNARIRNYGSALEAALSGDDVPVSVYDTLISVIHSNLPLLHRYVELRRRALKLDAVHMYDIYAPLSSAPIEDIPYDRALTLVEEGLAPLGEDYRNAMKNGIAEGWIDVYENIGKTSGAYSFGSYDSMPYILLNYDDRLKDVFTLAHEMGHSMHSHYTRKAQPFVYGGHSIFTAEVASTVNENLLMHHLIEKETDPVQKLYLINLHLEEFRATVFRQTMFAEFERMTHEAVEAGEVLTAEWLSEHYMELNQAYYGPKVVYDPQIAFEWSRIPHFYHAFYVYKYATGYSAAVALSKRILSEGPQAQADYLAFLKSGESDDPIPLLKAAGVDMSSPKPIEEAMASFAILLDELEQLIG